VSDENKTGACSSFAYEPSGSVCVKPPLGLRPRWIAEEQRLAEIASAADRYIEAGKPVPSPWIEEMIHYIGKLELWRAWAKRDSSPNAESIHGGKGGLK
jgi:hypothetical protein